MTKRTRRKFGAEDKVKALRRHLLDQEPVPDICDDLGLQPSVFYVWQRQFFENGQAAFESRKNRGDGPDRRLKEKVEKLEEKLSKKDEVIAEVTAEFVALKKELGEL